ncbi:MAG: ABC transporter permease [Chryseolinea sp.]
MLIAYLKFALRNLQRRTLYSVINISGLALGIAACLVIWRYVDFELSYDNFHSRADNIYRTTFTEYGKNWKDDWFAEFGYGLGPALIDEIPEIKSYARVHPLYGDAALVSINGSDGDAAVFQEKDVYFVDPAFMSMFTYKVVSGDSQHALDKPSSLVITESAAKRYFGNKDPIGQSMQVKTKDWGDGNYIVAAVIEDVPGNAHLQFEILLPMYNLLQLEYYRDPEAAWTAINFTTYVELAPGTDAQSLELKTKRFMDKQVGTEPLGVRLSYQPLRELNLSPDLNSANSHLKSLYFFVLISIFILCIAWINYVNLSTARAIERAKEVGVKKSMGVLKHQLIAQFMTESILINCISVLLAIGLASILLPVLSNIVGKEITFDFSDRWLWLILGGILAVGALISGVYPAFILSSYRTTEVIKGTPKGERGFGLRKALVVFQFSSSLFMIAGTFVIYSQLDFMLKSDKGFNTDQMLIVTGPQIIDWKGSNERLSAFKNELTKIHSVSGVTSSGAIPGGGYSFTAGMQKAGVAVDKSKIRESVHVVWVDTDFIQTYKMRVLSGQSWNPNSGSEMNAVFINEAAMQRLGIATPEEARHEKIILGDGEPIAIQGVIKNFHWNSPMSEYEPMLLRTQAANYNLFSVQLTGDIHESVQQIERSYRKLFPENPFDYYFLDDFFNMQYKDVRQTESIFGVFSILAIAIACLGLWGLASFTITNRIKEISIRKVLGATAEGIVSLLSMQFVKLVAISGLIALPIVWYLAKLWITNFAFRIDLTIELFAIPLAALAGIALATVSLQIFRGANTNPGKTLRSE